MIDPEEPPTTSSDILDVNTDEPDTYTTTGSPAISMLPMEQETMVRLSFVSDFSNHSTVTGNQLQKRIK
jgi:hypothetical protein